MNNSQLFERDQPVPNHLVELRQKSFDLLQAINDLDDHRQILREAQDFRRVEDAVTAEAHHPAQHRRAREPGISGPVDDHLIERMDRTAVALAEAKMRSR